MKKILVLLFLFMAFWGHAQSGISYQAVLMSPTAGQLPGADNPKSPLVNANICLRFSISASIGGIPEFQETTTASTDGFGMVNVVIGAVNPSGFAAISWVTGTKYLKVELDHTGSCNGSNTFSEVSEQPFTTVPFALYALNSGSGGGGGSTTTTLTGDVSGSATTGSITTTITNNAITTAKIANSSVTNAKLQNSSITINGNTIPLGGTATIAVTADANTLTGTTLASNVVNSSLTTVGTLNNLSVTNPIVGSITGNAATVTTNADLSGDVKSIGNTTTIEPNAVTSSKILDGTIAVDDLGPNAVTTVKLANDAVNSAKILDGTIAVDDLGPNAVTTVKLANDAVNSAKILDGSIANTDISSLAAIEYSKLNLANSIVATDLNVDAVEEVKIKDAAVTYAKIQNISTSNKVLGRISTGAGVIEEISTTGTGDVVRANSPILSGTPSLPTGTTGVTQIASDNSTALATTAFVYNANSTNANLTGPITSVGNTTTITDAAVNFTKIQNVNTNKVLGRISTGAGVIEEITTTGSGNVVRAISPTLTGTTNVTNLIASGTLEVNSATTLNGNLTVADHTLLGGNLSVNENTTITGTLGVTGTTTLNNNLTVRNGGIDKFTINALNGNTTVAGTLNAGATSLSSTLEVTGATTLNGNLTVRDGGIDKFTVNATNGDTTVDGKLNVNKIVDNNAVIDNSGIDNITINSMSGRFKFPYGLSKIKVYNSNVNINSIILCTVTKNIFLTSYNTNNYILSVDADNLFFTVTLLSAVNSVDKFDINFLVINNNL